MLTPIEPDVNSSGRYSVTQTCRILGIHRNSLRRYTEEGLIRCSFRKNPHRKFYTGREIMRFWQSQY